MGVSYKKLWKLLIDKNMGKGQLREAAHLAPHTLTKMGKGEPVSLTVLCRICDTLGVDLGDIVSYTPAQKEDIPE